MAKNNGGQSRKNQSANSKGVGNGRGPAKGKGNSQGKANGQGKAGQGDDKAKNNGRRRKNSRKKKVDPTVFWGDPEKLAIDEQGPALINSNPSALVQSLGRPPLAGQQNAAELYFTAVYDRSVNLGAALAAAGGLLAPDDLP